MKVQVTTSKHGSVLSKNRCEEIIESYPILKEYGVKVIHHDGPLQSWYLIAITVNTLEDVKEIMSKIEESVILSFGYDYGHDFELKLEIYDDYRE